VEDGDFLDLMVDPAVVKILFLSHYYPSEGNAPVNREGVLAKRWVAAGHEVTVVPNVPNGVEVRFGENIVQYGELVCSDLLNPLRCLSSSMLA
jgi:hypothetical protein